HAGHRVARWQLPDVRPALQRDPHGDSRPRHGRDLPPQPDRFGVHGLRLGDRRVHPLAPHHLPARASPRVCPWGRMVYLFMATAVVAVIPASFLTFSTTPVYALYELAPRVTALTAREDQQIAGIIMKLATVPVVWTTIAVMWFRWAKQEGAMT